MAIDRTKGGRLCDIEKYIADDFKYMQSTLETLQVKLNSLFLLRDTQ